MFKKLLSNLPFNPSLITQVSFYAKRVKQESGIRRTAFVFMAMAMVVQFFAVISPPQPTLADSDNDILYGGFTSREDAATKCLNNVQNFRTILDYYGISCEAVATANPNIQTLNSRSLGGELDSLGRTPVSAFHPNTNKASDQYPVSIPGAGQTLYMKNLWYWDSNSSSAYRVLEVNNKYGEQMWIIMDCGNIVTEGPYSPPVTPQQPLPPPPPPVIPPEQLSCSKLTMNFANGSKIKLGDKVKVRGQASGRNVRTGTLVDMYYDFVDATTNRTVKSDKALGISFSGTFANDPLERTFSTTTPGKYLIKLTVKYDGSTKTAAGSASGECVKNVSVQKPCPNAQGSQDLENCLDEHKTGFNMTQGAKKANTTVAKAGDIIQYNLTVTNTGNITVPKSEYQMQENISDILDYADVVDLGGGTKNASNIVSWPRVDIQPQQTIQKTLKVKLKATIPSTPVSSSDPGRFDCYMMNVFGVDSVNVKVDCPIIKTIEITNQELPKTGPGSSLAIGFAIIAVGGYFFARSRLFATELDIVRADYAQSGGM